MMKWLKRLFIAIGVIVFATFLISGYWLVWGSGRYYFFLPYASKVFLKYKAFNTVEAYSNEMLQTAGISGGDENCDWNYGNAIHDANNLLGRVALKRGNIEKAKKHLIEAGKTPGSPQLNSFGPSMALAQELLENGERDVVIEYLELCRVFWEMHEGLLDKWQSEIQEGNIPNLDDKFILLNTGANNRLE